MRHTRVESKRINYTSNWFAPLKAVAAAHETFTRTYRDTENLSLLLNELGEQSVSHKDPFLDSLEQAILAIPGVERETGSAVQA